MKPNQILDHPSINRYDDGAINIEFYIKRGRQHRSGKAWDILTHICQQLPFFRDVEDETEQHQTSTSRVGYSG